MTWRIRVRHESAYHYETEVRSSYNEARITPLTTPDQLVLEAAVSVNPNVRPFRYWDYWGAVVHAFDIHQPHTTMEVVGNAVVETSVPTPTKAKATWADLHSNQVCDDYSELLAPTVYVPTDFRIEEVARRLRGLYEPAEAAAHAIDWVRNELDYVPGATEVQTSAIEAWEGRRGVCQDFAHLSLALIRAMGIPARYCSGYLHPNPDAGIGTMLLGQSHAWVEHWTGGWQGMDPTIGWPVGERHVLVARGRDYRDVSPLRGIYNGGRFGALSVSVQLTRLG